MLSDFALPDGSSQDGVVRILTGDVVSKFKGVVFVGVPSIDLDGVRTPFTPDSEEWYRLMQLIIGNAIVHGRIMRFSIASFPLVKIDRVRRSRI